MALLHETCTSQNDIAMNSPITGTSSIRKLLNGTWTRTCITTNCGGGGGGSGSGSGSAACYGPGGSGNGTVIKEVDVKEGGTRHMPDQHIIVIMGGA